jgi:hypothetical protein
MSSCGQQAPVCSYSRQPRALLYLRLFAGEQQRRGLLEQALSHRKVAVIGDPGSGRSTFLRRVAFKLCRNLRGTRPERAESFLPPAASPY